MVDLSDPALYADGAPHELFAQLREDEGVHAQRLPDGRTTWWVLRHHDVQDVARHPLLYSSAKGGIVIEDLSEEQLAMLRQTVLAMDPPQHTNMRKVLVPHFRARVMGQLEDQIRAVCRQTLGRVVGAGECDLIHEVAAPLPTQVLGVLAGIPDDERSMVHELAEQITGGAGPDGDGYTPSIKMALYGAQLAARRRVDPTPDIVTVLVETPFEGRNLEDIEIGSLLVQLVTAGNDTSRTLLGNTVDCLLDHPDQLEAIRKDAELIPAAIEEVTRWANPLHYFRRTATADARLGDAEIKDGDKVVMVYTAANRDPRVFTEAEDFDIRRHPNPHVSFGFADHFCLGVHLARLLARVFLDELLTAAPTIERTAPKQRQPSTLTNGLTRLPVRLA
ncbi:MAG TPA: cytochrome P450 [Mycobacteriales bacterium]|nr:cytochrome P450 [Mycobacteriales bacterium]